MYITYDNFARLVCFLDNRWRRRPATKLQSFLDLNIGSLVSRKTSSCVESHRTLARLSQQLLQTTWQQCELQIDSDIMKLKEFAKKFNLYAQQQAPMNGKEHIY